MYKNFIDKLNDCLKKNDLPQKYYQILLELYNSYEKETNESNFPKSTIRALFDTLTDMIVEQIQSPFIFDLYHEKITEPFNYYQFGLDFIFPLVDMEKSKVYGLENVKKMQEQINKKENVVLFANHQTEADPQLINIMLQDTFKKFASEMIFIAGERVITDPLAIPFSMGCNLLSIYSKRYIAVKPELTHQKQLHNKRVMELMSQLLQDGGKVIYVAPSGGRDRIDENNQIQVAPFDPQSVEMLTLMAKRTTKKTHFYPLVLDTYHILPPPSGIQIEMGEERIANRCPVHLSFGEELDMEKYPGNESPDKKEKRKNRANYIWKLVENEYKRIIKEK